MPGSTPILGIPYPLLGETINPSDFQNFANAIDTILNTNVLLGQDALDRPFAQVFPDAISLTQAVDTTLTFNTTSTLMPFINNDGMFSTATPDRFTVQTPGVYMVNINNLTVTGFATVTSWRLSLLQNGTMRYAERKNESSSSEPPDTCVTGLIACSAADTLQVRGLWTGTGGPATLLTIFAAFSARFVCPLV